MLLLLALIGAGVVIWKVANTALRMTDGEVVHVIKADNLLGDIMQTAIENVIQELKIADDVEKSLFLRAMKDKAIGGPMTVTIILVRPAEAARGEVSETYESRNDDQEFVLRMTKLGTNSVIQPIGIIHRAAIVDGKLFTDQTVVRFQNDGLWHEFPSE